MNLLPVPQRLGDGANARDHGTNTRWLAMDRESVEAHRCGSERPGVDSEQDAPPRPSGVSIAGAGEASTSASSALTRMVTRPATAPAARPSPVPSASPRCRGPTGARAAAHLVDAERLLWRVGHREITTVLCRGGARAFCGPQDTKSSDAREDFLCAVSEAIGQAPLDST
jgi:hypothetical protein